MTGVQIPTWTLKRCDACGRTDWVLMNHYARGGRCLGTADPVVVVDRVAAQHALKEEFRDGAYADTDRVFSRADILRRINRVLGE